MKKSNISLLDLDELLAHVYAVDEEQEDIFEVVDRVQFEMDCPVALLHDFTKRLLPLVSVWQSPLTNKCYRGFAFEDEDGLFTALVKEEIPGGAA